MNMRQCLVVLVVLLIMIVGNIYWDDEQKLRSNLCSCRPKIIVIDQVQRFGSPERSLVKHISSRFP